MFARDVDVEVERNDQWLLLFVEQLLEQRFEWTESFVVELMLVHHSSSDERSSLPLLPFVVLAAAVQLYDRNVSDNTVRRLDHFDWYQLSLMMCNEYRNEENRVLWNYDANLDVFVYLKGMKKMKQIEREKDIDYMVQFDCNSNIQSFDSQICLLNHSFWHISSHLFVQTHSSIRRILNKNQITFKSHFLLRIK